MKAQKESPAGKQGQEERHECTTNSKIKATVRALFSSGNKLTARDINIHTGGNDARKVISDLRREGWNITDMRLPDNRKLYWLVSPDRQLPLFPKRDKS